MEEWGFPAGELVELHGLSKLELNGQKGTVLALESPEQARQLRRLPVMLHTGNRLSIKVENLRRLPAHAVRNGGDLGPSWSSVLQEQGLSVSVPLHEASSQKPGDLARTDLVLATLNLRHLANFPMKERDAFRALDELVLQPQPPDLICIEDGVEGWEALTKAGYAKLISSAVRAQNVHDSLYGDPRYLDCVPREHHTKLAVNELYIRSRGCSWELIESGVEQLSSDVMLDEGMPLAVRIATWVRLRPKGLPEGPVAFVLHTQLTGERPLEEQFFLRPTLAGERKEQIQRAAALVASRREAGDLVALLGTLRAALPQEEGWDDIKQALPVQAEMSARGLTDDEAKRLYDDFLQAPRKVLSEGGWQFPARGLALSREAATTPLTEAGQSGGSSSSTYGCVVRKTSIGVRRSQQAPHVQWPEARKDLPLVGLGTCFLPEDLQEQVSDTEFREEVEKRTYLAVKTALEAGVRLFDTSNAFINQSFVGKALRMAVEGGVVSRPELFIIGHVVQCKNEAAFKMELEVMLTELRLDYVDMLVLDVPPELARMVWPWAEEGYREGKARYLGISNFDLLGPKVCVEVLRSFLSAVEVPPVAHFMEVHPLNINVEMSELCRNMSIQTIAFSPLGAGHKIESYLKAIGRSSASALRPMLKCVSNPVAREVGRRHGVSAAQVVLRWNLQRGHCVLPKSFNPNHILQNLELFNFTLTPEEMHDLSDLHAEVRGERFLSQAANATASKPLPRMTQDAQEACAKVMAKMLPGNVAESDLDPVSGRLPAVPHALA